MATGLVAEPPCAVCHTPSARVEIVAPGKLPAEWDQWSETRRESFRRYREEGQWWLIFEGVAAGSGGMPITAEKAARITGAFAVPYSYDRVHTADFYDDAGFCGQCGVPYCRHHWQVSRSGYGRCPNGHGKSLDPHWSPEDFDL